MVVRPLCSVVSVNELWRSHSATFGSTCQGKGPTWEFGGKHVALKQEQELLWGVISRSYLVIIETELLLSCLGLRVLITDLCFYTEGVRRVRGMGSITFLESLTLRLLCWKD